MGLRHRVRSLLASLVAIAIFGVAGVAAASALLADGGESAEDAAAVAGSESAEGRADDPRRGLPFGVLVWRNAAGLTCAALGRRVGDRITDASGSHDYRIADGGGCVDVASLPGDLDVRKSGEHPDRSGLAPVTVIWGLAKRGVVEVRVRSERGYRVAKVTARGAFVTTFPGALAEALDVVAVTADDRRIPMTFPAAPAELRDRILNPRSADDIRREILLQKHDPG